MDVRQVEYVAAVVDHGGFGAGAAALGVAQPSLSQGIRALENELGVELFDRRARPVQLTAAGLALLEPARRALRNLDTARAAVDQVRGVTAGHLDLVCLPTLSVDPVAELVGRFRASHPGVAVRIHEPDDAATVSSAVRSGASEVGACDLPLADPDGLAVHEMDRQGYQVVLAPTAAGSGRSARRRPPITVDELAGLPLITMPEGTSTRSLLDQALARAGHRPIIAVETDHREAIVPLVLAGAGAAFVPDALAADARTRGAVAVALARPLHRRIGLIHASGPLSPAAAAFVALAVPGHARGRRPPARRR